GRHHLRGDPRAGRKKPIVLSVASIVRHESERPPIVFYAFDLIQLNSKDLRNLPIEERNAKLEELLKKPPGVLRYSASFTKDIPELLDRARRLDCKRNFPVARF